MDDKKYRQLADTLLCQMCEYFDEFDPDEIEAELVPGALTLTTSDGAKFIVSQQGAHQQIWLATPEVGRRYNYDAAAAAWVDTKDGTTVQLMLGTALTDKLGQPIAFP